MQVLYRVLACVCKMCALVTENKLLRGK